MNVNLSKKMALKTSRKGVSLDNDKMTLEIINDMINLFKHEGEFINPEYIKIKFSDEADKKFYEVYKSGKAKYLITGNKKHFPPKENTIILPRNFMQIYEK
jgi:predicted nucleic acid-binding protein